MKEKTTLMPLNLQFFAEGGEGDNGINTVADLDKLLDEGMKADVGDAGKDAGTKTDDNAGNTDDTKQKANEQSKDGAGAQDDNKGTGDGDAGKQQGDQKTDDKTNAAFAQMRSENSKFKKILERAAQAEGLNVDDYLNKMDEAANNAEAKAKNMDPQVYKELQELRRSNDELRNQMTANERRMLLANNMKRVQTLYNLSDDGVRSFAEDIVANNIDVLSNTVDLSLVYKGLYHDKLVEAATEAARQEWIKTAAKSEHAASTVQGKGTGNQDAGDVKSLADLDKLVGNLNAR